MGNMGGKQNTKMLKKAVSVSQEDIENFLYPVSYTHLPIRHGAIPVQSGWKVNKVECETASSKNPEDYVSLGNG